ncbi:MAG: hypothetical protein ACE5GE_00665 [Phycisphaerae bacterium]
MSASAESNVPLAPLRTVQIIVMAMCAGCVASGAVAVLLHRTLADTSPKSQPAAWVTMIAVAYAASMLPVGFLLPAWLTSGQIRRVSVQAAGSEDPNRDAAWLAKAFVTETIIGAALVEGAALFGSVAYLVEGDTLSLAAGGVMLAVLIGRFPTQNRLTGWLTARLQQLKEARLFGG